MIHKKAIQKCLDAAKIKYFTSHSSSVIHLKCPWHQDSKTPSLVIYTESPPHIYCFGCGKHGLWKKLQEILNLGELEKEWNDPDALNNLIHEYEVLDFEPKLPPMVKTWKMGSFRKCSEKILKKLHSQWWFDEIDGCSRLLWPIWNISEDLVGWVARRLDGNDENTKYRNAPRMEILSTLWPFPSIHQLKKEKNVVLVEGPYDAIRLLSHGIPALAVLGTNWSVERSMLVEALGVGGIVLALDGDAAGKNGTLKIGSQLEKYFSKEIVKVWQWSEGVDPGSASVKEIKELKKELNLPLEKNSHYWLDIVPYFKLDWKIKF